jgi:ferredoxin
MDPSRLEVWIDRDECVSAGRCVATAPGFFRFDDDELAEVDPHGDRPDDEALLRIARACPNGAIHVARNGVELEL